MPMLQIDDDIHRALERLAKRSAVRVDVERYVHHVLWAHCCGICPLAAIEVKPVPSRRRWPFDSKP